MPETTDESRDVQSTDPEVATNESPGEEAVAAQSEPEGEADPGDTAEGLVHQLRPEAAAASEPGDGDGWRNLQRMLDVPLSLTVELGSTEMPLSEVLHLEGGSVITLDRMPGEPIDLLINGRIFAKGEVVVVNETFGFRITELVQDAEGAIDIGGDGG